MPIVDPSDEIAVARPPAVSRAAAPTYQGVVVDTRLTPTSALLTHVEGSSWTVNYYSQVLDTDSAVAGQNVNRDAIYQQYRLVRDFELKVTTPLSTVQDAESKALEMRGSANVYPFLIPNVGDMFIADIGDGRGGIFRITQSERRSVFKETAHAIEYVWVEYAEPQRLADLQQKVVESLYFVKDFIQHGQNPLLHSEDYAITAELSTRYQELCLQYFTLFMNHEFKTLTLPGQLYPTYDPFLTKAVKSYFSTWAAKELQHVRTLNVDGDPAMRALTLWDAIAQRDANVLVGCAQRMALVSARTFDRNPIMEGIYWSGINSVVYPRDPQLYVDYAAGVCPKVPSERVLETPPSRLTNLADQLPQTTIYQSRAVGGALIHPVLKDTAYVLTEAFYRNTAGQSQLECQVRNYLEGRAIDNRVLQRLVQTTQAWGPLERFYYLPLVMVLIKASIRSL